MAENGLTDQVSTGVITHFAPRETYGDLAPPSAGIVSTTVDSALERLDGLTADTVHV